ncbi:DUF7006 family protein [Enterococcus lactis]|uniref:DUF7006 family protein n=1 Tax=Enterococcus lactis TaxID=357441 RepID=UPI003D995FDE
MNSKEIFNIYFSYYDFVFNDKHRNQRLISEKYYEIKNNMKNIIEEVNKNNFLQIMREVLDLDAQLQIMITLIEPHMLFDEKQVLELVSSDYIYYYKEIFDHGFNKHSPRTILHILQE